MSQAVSGLAASIRRAVGTFLECKDNDRVLPIFSSVDLVGVTYCCARPHPPFA
jgi:hypothetical protein